MELKSGTTQQLTVSDYTSLERKKWVLDRILSGDYPAVIREEYKQLYPVGDHSYDADTTWAYRTLRKKGENEVDQIIERHTDRYNYLYKLAVEKGDLRSAAVVLKQLEDLYKLHKPSSGSGNVNVQVNQITSHMPLDDLYKQLNIEKPSLIISIEPEETTGENE